MSSLDLIRHTLARPIDWGVFENLAVEVLAQDDLPELRGLGGMADAGADAEQDKFYEDGLRKTVVVQVTSQEDQLAKLHTTINRLREVKANFDNLIMVYRAPVATDTKKKIKDAAEKKGVVVDIRDQEYLVRRLGTDKGITLFRRYFGTVRQQVAQLLEEDESLETADTVLRRAMLASIGTYITNPAAQLVKTTLFDRTILALVVANGGGITLDELRTKMVATLSDESVAKPEIIAGIGRLAADRLCIFAGETISATTESLEKIGGILAAVGTALAQMRQYVIASVAEQASISQADKGRLEGNLRRALAGLFRRIGPTLEPAEDVAEALRADDLDIVGTLGEGLDESATRSAVAALNDFVADPANVETLAVFARSYAALSIRNTDPLGRKFQAEALAQSVIVLDTDAVLALTIEELPGHAPLLRSISALAGAGMSITIPQSVLQEAVGHIGRAHRSYLRVAAALPNQSPDYVDAEVWHAVVRGYYYHLQGGGTQDFLDYWRNYHEPERPLEFVEFALHQRFNFTIDPDAGLHLDDAADFEAMMPRLLEKKEAKRLKAEFRDTDYQTQRLKVDLRCALDVARRLTDKSLTGRKGYLVSSDRVFPFLQRLSEWGPRPRIYLPTDSLAGLAEFICGLRLDADQIVRILFNPVHVAAAEQLKEPLLQLARAGVDLRKASLGRLEWDMRTGLREAVETFQRRETQTDAVAADRVESGLALSEKAVEFGYSIDRGVAEMLNEFQRVKGQLREERAKRSEAEQVTQRLIDGASGLSKKGKRRVQAILHDLGGWKSKDESK